MGVGNRPTIDEPSSVVGSFVKRTRIVLAGMSSMMLNLVDRIITCHPDLHVAARVPADDELRAAVRRSRADVLVLMHPDGGGLESSVEGMLWCRPSKVLAIADGGRRGVLLRLRPHATVLDDLSADGLVDAIRSTGDA